MTKKSNYVLTALLLALICLKFGQSQSTTSWPEEHGLIITGLSYEGVSQLRHFPEYPGYENISGELSDADVIVSDATSLTFPNPNTVMKSICVDYRKKSIYMYDNGQSTITMGTGYSKELNISRMELVEMRVPVSKGDIKLAVDWLSHTVYWADPGFRWIAAAPGQRDKVEKGYYKIIVRSHVDVLQGIALDPLEAVLFWTDKGQFPKIECSDLAGRERRTILSKYLKSPSGLVADIFGKRIYWLDDYADSIVSVTYNGDDPKTIVKIHHSLFLEGDVFRDILYVTDVYKRNVYAFNKTSGKEIVHQIAVNSKSYGIAVYSDENQPIKKTDHCEAKKCEHFCITEKHSAMCVCSEGYSLIEITGKCQENSAGYHKAIVMANTTNICLIEMRAFMGSNFSLKCIFSVNSQKGVLSPLWRKKRQLQPSSETTPSSNQSTTPAIVATPITTATVAPTVPPGAFIEEFDMDMANRIIFFATADNTIYKRPIDALIEDESTELIVKAAGNISGLAYDAEDTNNLYWCESDTGNIWVINTVSRAAKNITPVDSGIRTAKDIIVLLNKRILAMITGEYPNMSLQTMTLVERKFNALVSLKIGIAAFTYDSEKEIFYYISTRLLYSVPLDGGKSRFAFREIDLAVGINSLVLYQNYLAWSYQNGAGTVFKTFGLLDKTTSDPVMFANISQVDIKILDIMLQTPKHISPCAKDNGGCSQICITRYINGEMEQDCECRLGYTLENNVSCTTEIVNDNFALVMDSTNEEIFQVNLDTQEVHAVPGKGFTSVRGIYYDDVREKVIVAQWFSSEIISLNLNGSNHEVLADLVPLDGGKSRFAFREIDLAVGINSLVLYQNYLAWSYQNGAGTVFKTFGLLDKTTSDPVMFANISQVDIKILDIMLQTPKHISPCAKDNGGCSQICITRYINGEMEQDCECRLGYTLENNVSCTTEIVNDNFALVMDSTNEEIFQVNLDTQEVHAVPGKGFTSVRGIYYDDVREKVIVAQWFSSEIISLNLNGSNHEVLADLGRDVYAVRFDLDRTTGNLYIFTTSFIGIITRSGEWMYFAIVKTHRGYNINRAFTPRYICRANMDGSEAKILIQVSGNPSGLMIDYVNDHVFWSDSAYDTVQKCNLDGLDCVTVVNMTGTGEREEITDLETDGVYVYYTSYRKSHFVRVELTKPYKREIIARNYGFGKLRSMTLYSSKTKNVQPLSEGCRNRSGLGDCSTICLPTPTGRTCACESGVCLQLDGRTCSNVYQCTGVIQQTVMLASGEEGIIDIVIDLTCSRYIDSKCNYTCPISFESTFDTLLTCTDVGWNLKPYILCKAKDLPKTELSVPGVVAGFVVLGTIIIGLVALVIVLFRRKLAFSTYACFDNKRGGSISIGNPGFGLTS